MKINLSNDQQIIEEVFNVLIENLDTSTVMRFWKICNLENSNYSQIKEQLFAGETVDSLYDKIKAMEEEQIFN
jgi:hypothetical protein